MTDADLERLFVLDAGPGPAVAIGAAHADAIIDSALAGAGFGPGGGGGSSGTGGASTSGSAAIGTKLAILGGAALVVVAIALFVGRGRPRGNEQVAASIDDAGMIDSGGAGLGVAPPVEPADDATFEPTIEPADDVVMKIDPSTPMPPKREAPTHRESAADLLGEANAKRTAKQWRQADILYARVAEHAPKSLAAQTALIASASLHLEHLGDPRGAAQRLRRALAIAPSGALAEEARWGLAEAARAMHDRAGEAAALDDFLAHHASSPLAARANARRAELP